MEKSRVQPGLLRKMNERQILEVIQTQGPISRAEVRRISGISAPTVSKTVAKLLETQFLEEHEHPASTPGRPSKLLRLARNTVQVIGIVVGVKKCSVVSAGLDGHLFHDQTREFETPGHYEAMLEELANTAKIVMDSRKVPTLGLGVCIPGLLNRTIQQTVFSPNLRQLDGHQLGNELAEILKVEAFTIQENHALCLAERNFGLAKGLTDFAVVDATEGLGLGVFNRGQYVDGHSGLGLELGHVTLDPRGKLCRCGNHGCFQTVATDEAFAEALVGSTLQEVSVDQVVESLKNGDVQPSAGFNECIEYLAIAASLVINLFNPSQLFVGSRFLQTHSWLFDHFSELARRRSLQPTGNDCEILLSTSNRQQGAVAGIIHHLTAARGPTLDSDS